MPEWKIYYHLQNKIISPSNALRTTNQVPSGIRTNTDVTIIIDTYTLCRGVALPPPGFVKRPSVMHDGAWTHSSLIVRCLSCVPVWVLYGSHRRMHHRWPFLQNPGGGSATAPTERVRSIIWNVGIGTASPGTGLDVAGAQRIRGTNIFILEMIIISIQHLATTTPDILTI